MKIVNALNPVAAKAAAVCAVALFASLSISALAAPPDQAVGKQRTEVIQTADGPIRGFVDDGMKQFLGIPYAAPPVGDLRWKAPQPPKSWLTPLDVVKFGNICVARNTLGVFASISDTEDCLYLNVFTPAEGAQSAENKKHPLKPVMVWIYGGGLASGETDIYNPSKLVKQGDVVFVSMNYRANILGFMAHPALDSDDNPHVNYGIMDWQAALRWVKQNINKFGGDPNNVTIFGESAGGTAVIFNMMSPASAGLFHRAIIHSPAFAATQATYAQAVARGQLLAAAVGCGSDASAATASCLRSASTQSIINSGFVAAGPVRALDGKILTINMGEALATGQFNRVPVIVGNNRDEQTFFLGITELSSGSVLTAAGYPAAVTASFGAANAPLVLAQYPLANYPTPSNALTAAQTDRGFACGTRRGVTKTVSQFVPTYAYLFADRTAPAYMPPVSFPYLAGHTLELEYLFSGYHGASGVAHPLNQAQSQLSDDMVTYWTNFARTGNPNSAGVPNWDLYNVQDNNHQLLDLPHPTKTLQYNQIHKCDFWDSLG